MQDVDLQFRRFSIFVHVFDDLERDALAFVVVVADFNDFTEGAFAERAEDLVARLQHVSSAVDQVTVVVVFDRSRRRDRLHLCGRGGRRRRLRGRRLSRHGRLLLLLMFGDDDAVIGGGGDHGGGGGRRRESRNGRGDVVVIVAAHDDGCGGGCCDGGGGVGGSIEPVDVRDVIDHFDFALMLFEILLLSSPDLRFVSGRGDAGVVFLVVFVVQRGNSRRRRRVSDGGENRSVSMPEARRRLLLYPLLL